MNFHGEILVERSGGHARTHWSERAGPELSFVIGEANEFETRARKVIEEYVASTGIHYLDEFSQGGDWVTCPFAKVTVPIDRWDCKITNQRCPIQSKIDLTSKERFFAGCNVETAEETLESKHNQSAKEFKENIWKTVSEGDYQGYHHHPGTAPCSFCDGHIRDAYHLPWEMTRIYKHMTDEELARTSIELVKAGIAYKLGNAICAGCFMSLEETYPDIDFSIYGLDLEDYNAIEYRYSP